MQHVTLKAGGTVDLRDPAEIPERLRRPIRTLQLSMASNPAFAGVVKDAEKSGITEASDISSDQAMDLAAAMGPETMAMLDDLNDHAILSRVMGWSFEAAVTKDGLLDLPGPAYDELKELCAKGALGGPDFSPTQDENSPTEPSTASARP